MLSASLLLLTVTSACSLGEGGPSQSAPEAPAADSGPESKVENPKNLSGIADACRLLTPQQLSALHIDGEPEKGTNHYGGPSCKFNGEALSTSLDVDTNYGGLDQLYGNKDSFDNFAPTEVSGYPGAQFNFSDTLCTVSTAIADDQSFEVYYAKNSGGTPEMDDPCGYAKKIAAEAMNNIPAA